MCNFLESVESGALRVDRATPPRGNAENNNNGEQFREPETLQRPDSVIIFEIDPCSIGDRGQRRHESSRFSSRKCSRACYDDRELRGFDAAPR